MSHTYAVVIEPAGLCRRCLQQLGGDGERVGGVGFRRGRLTVQVLAASQAARSAGPVKSSRASARASN
jgi:hypothetical protein